MHFWSNGFFSAASSPRLAHRGLLTAARPANILRTLGVAPAALPRGPAAVTLAQYQMCVRTMATAACSPLHDWPPARVAEWAASIISLENAALLKDQEICGKSLLTLRKHELKSIGMTLGSASNLLEAVSKLVSPGVWFVFIAARLPTSALPPASFAPNAPRSPRAAL
jgi:hypothetical protein